MRNILFFIILCCIVASCTNSVIKKPKNLIDEDQMELIIYDLALLESMKTNLSNNDYEIPTSKQFLEKKYKIDSLSFSQNMQYYAQNVDDFKHLHDRVKKKLEENAKLITKEKNVTTSSDDEGVVK